MAIFKCKMCGGSLEVTERMTVCECEYCGTQQTIPKTDNEQTLNMFNRANHFRQQCEFDKAAEIYERMTAQRDDAELYWSIVLCKYGIEYVDDPMTKKKIPTCHRTQYKSILEDADYLEALERADSIQRSVYEREAAYIDKVQKGILEISNKEEPFDVFICYKETYESGRRTQDSVLAQELYYGLVQEGFKVFFSRITLESKLGMEYEPYIFAALNSAKVMVVVGTKPEYFNSVWVRNEWSRYLMLMQNDRSRTIIPAYKDMDPYDLPDALSMFQAQDMSRLGFMQDLIRGINKIIRSDEPKQTVVKETVVQKQNGSNVENLIKRGMLSLEDGKWDDANNFFEQVLNEDVEESRAYFGKLLAELKIHSKEELKKACFADGISSRDNFKKALRFADDEYKKLLSDLDKQTIYNKGLKIAGTANHSQYFIQAAKYFKKLGDFKDSKQKVNEYLSRAMQMDYDNAIDLKNHAYDEKQFKSAEQVFIRLGHYRDCIYQAAECKRLAEETRKSAIYRKAVKDISSATDIDEFGRIRRLLSEISDYRDAERYIKKCSDLIEQIKRKEEIEEEKILRVEKKKRIIKIVSIISSVVVIIVTIIILNVARTNKARELLADGDFAGACKTIGRKKFSEFMEEEGYHDQLVKFEKDLNSYAGYYYERGGWHTTIEVNDDWTYSLNANEVFDCGPYDYSFNLGDVVVELDDSHVKHTLVKKYYTIYLIRGFTELHKDQ